MRLLETVPSSMGVGGGSRLVSSGAPSALNAKGSILVTECTRRIRDQQVTVLRTFSFGLGAGVA